MKHNYELSIDYYQKSLVLKQNILLPNDEDIAKVYHDIALSYYRLENYNQAIKYYGDALKCNSLRPYMADYAHLNSAHSYLRRTELNNSDDIWSAIDHFHAALEIELKIETLSRSKIGETYRFLGLCYENVDNFEMAINYYTQALEIYQNENWNDECDQIKDEIEEVRKKKLNLIKRKLNSTWKTNRIQEVFI